MKKILFLFLYFYTITNSYSQTSDQYYNIGILKDNQGKYEEAIEDFTYAIEIDVYGNKIYYGQRAISKSDLGDYRGALADYEIVISADPKNAWAIYGRGLNNIKLGQKCSGCLDLSKARELGIKKAYETIKELCN